MTGTRELILAMLETRLDQGGQKWLSERTAEIGAGVSDDRFANLISLASRFAPRGTLAPTESELAEARVLLEGWNPERWTVLEALRVALVLARPDLESDSVAVALEEAFKYADDGELRALYKSLSHLPQGERFAWRAGEGCRTNIVPVFESVACDSPYAARYFDDVAWNQLVIKAIFIGAPLWRVFGLDKRLSPELARMALDLADERRSAGRDVQHELWLCLGVHSGARGQKSLEQELESSNTLGRRAAAIGLARTGIPQALERLRALADTENDPEVAETMRNALDGRIGQDAFADLDQQTV